MATHDHKPSGPRHDDGPAQRLARAGRDVRSLRKRIDEAQEREWSAGARPMTPRKTPRRRQR